MEGIKFILFFLCHLTLAQDPMIMKFGKKFQDRYDHLTKFCDKFADPFRYEEKPLYQPLDAIYWSRIKADAMNGYFVCPTTQINREFWSMMIKSTQFNHCERLGNCTNVTDEVGKRTKDMKKFVLSNTG